MRDRDQHLADAEGLDDLASAAAERDRRFAVALVANFDVAEVDAADPARSHGFHHGLFRGPAASVMLCGRLARGAVLDLVRREHAGDKQLRVPLDHLGDPQYFDDIGANAENVHGVRWSVVGGQWTVVSGRWSEGRASLQSYSLGVAGAAERPRGRGP